VAIAYGAAVIARRLGDNAASRYAGHHVDPAAGFRKTICASPGGANEPIVVVGVTPTRGRKSG